MFEKNAENKSGNWEPIPFPVKGMEILASFEMGQGFT